MDAINNLIKFTQMARETFTNVAIPGLCYRAHRWWWIIGFYTLALVAVLFFASTRLIVDPSYLKVLTLSLLGLHLIAVAHGQFMSTKSAAQHGSPLKSILIAVITISLLWIGNRYKSILFGFEIYHIPSRSMAPTLVPGDIVVVDSWSKPITLKSGDIVVFQRETNGQVLIKRISELKGHQNQSMYLLGDNRSHSTDSRRYGWVSTELVQGVFKGVLVNIQSQM